MAFRRAWMILALIGALLPRPSLAADTAGRLVPAQIQSTSFAGNRIGIAALRDVTVYLPPGYDESDARYPVIYYLSPFWEDEAAPFAQHGARELFDAAIAEGVIGGVIVVTADFGTPLGGSWYVNSPVTGNWEDFMVRELVPYVDAHFRTLANSESRGVAGDRMGGYGALRFGMRHPQVFGAVYALHPIGMGQGLQPMFSRPDWDLFARAGSIDELRADGFAQIFASIFQAHLPAPDRPPLFFDPPARRVDGRLEVDAALTRRLQDSFFLERQVGLYADNLKRLRGLKLDWGRGDTNPDHIVSLQAFTRVLDEYAVPYEAEEYRGGFGDRNWGADGRIYSDMLPFFRETLRFAPPS